MDAGPEFAELMLWCNQVERTLQIFSQRLDQSDEHSTHKISASFRQRAELSTLRALLTELATHLGLPQDKIDATYHQLYLYHLDVFFQHGADMHKGSAAQLDDRTQEEIYTGESIPKLFPEDGESDAN